MGSTLLVICSPNPGHAEHYDVRQSSCPLNHQYGVAITDSSVGTLILNLSLDSILSLCPLARDTTVSGANQGPNAQRFPGRIYGSGRLQLIALQYQDSVLRPDRPADGWIVRGTGGTLPSGVPLTATWRELVAAYGRANASAGAVVVVQFCSLPAVLFTLNADPRAVVTTTGRVDLSRIPPTTTIHHIFILGRSLRGAVKPCA